MSVTIFGLPGRFEEMAIEIGNKYCLPTDQSEFLARYASSIARVAFSASDSSELDGMRSEGDQIASLDKTGNFEKALQVLKDCMGSFFSEVREE